MANFDPSLQVEHGKWEEGKHDGDLLVGVYTYRGGPPKLGINRYMEKKDGTVIIMKSGRLSWEDLMYIESILEEIKETMEGIK